MDNLSKLSAYLDHASDVMLKAVNEAIVDITCETNLPEVMANLIIIRTASKFAALTIYNASSMQNLQANVEIFNMSLKTDLDKFVERRFGS